MTTATEKTTLEVVRTLSAPPERVFAAWTRPEKIRLWFAPGDMTVPLATADVRVGGSYRIEMREPGGSTYVKCGTYREIVPNERLVFTWADESEPSAESLVTVTFRDLGGKTELKIVHERLASEESREMHLQGWIGCLANLDTAFALRAVNCADLGCCGDIVTAPDDAQLMERLFAHAGEAHPDMAKAMSPEQAEQIKARIPQVTYSL
jgi:uncharacterized protein YndB with AHSA1/START domain/predicted small metal-binding protein